MTQVVRDPAPLNDWLKKYNQTLATSFTSNLPDAASWQKLPLWVRRYEAPASPMRSASELSSSQRYSVLLGRAGSGKTTSLKHFVGQMAHVNSQASQSEETPLRLPVYLDLSKVTSEMLQSDGIRQNGGLIFESVLNRLMEGSNGNSPAPSGWTTGLALLLALDNLERLDATLAPLFFYHFNQWLKQVEAETSLIVACRTVSFDLYQPWFNGEQSWQFHELQGLHWSELKPLLADHLNAKELEGIEGLGLPPLLTHPALTGPLYTNLQSASEGAKVDGPARLYAAFQKFLVGDQPMAARQLANFSRWIKTAVAKNSAVTPSIDPALLAHAEAVGLVEKHPLGGQLEWCDELAEELATAWICLEATPQDLPSLIEEIVGQGQLLGASRLHNFLRLLYRLMPVERHTGLFTAWLGHTPIAERLEELYRLETSEPAFVADWQAFLHSQAHTPFGAQLFRLGGLNAAPKGGGSEARLALTRQALAQRQTDNTTDPTTTAELARLSEQLGQTGLALDYYRQAEQTGEMALGDRLVMSRLLTNAGEADEASRQLEQVRQRLNGHQAQFYDQYATLKRQQGDIQSALLYAQQAVGLDPLPEYQYHLALTLKSNSQLDEAVGVLTGLTNTRPDFGPAFYELGLAQLQQGQSEEARRNLTRAVTLEPARLNYLFDLARSLVAQGRYAEAQPYLQAAQSGPQPSAQVNLGLGLVRLELGQPEQAQADFGPLGTRAGLVGRAAASYAMADYPAALSDLEQALKVETQAAPITLAVLGFLLGQVAEAAGQLTVARTYYESVQTGSLPATLVWQRELGLSRIYRQTDLIEQAQHHAELVLLQQPGNAAGLYELGRIRMKQQTWPGAVQAFQTALAAGRAEPTDRRGALSRLFEAGPGAEAAADWPSLFGTEDRLAFDLPYFFGLSLARTGQHEDAQTIWQTQLMEIAGQNRPIKSRRQADLHYQLGLSYGSTDQTGEALSAFRQAVQICPSEVLYRLELARTLRTNGALNLAQTELNIARELDPNQPEVLAELAEVQLAQADPTQANLLASLNLYLRAKELAPTIPRYIYQAALLAYHLGHNNQTKTLLESLVTHQPALPQVYLLAACNAERGGEITLAHQQIKNALQMIAQSQLKPPAPVYRLVGARLARKNNDLTACAELIEGLLNEPGLPLDWRAAGRAERSRLAFARDETAAEPDWASLALTDYETWLTQAQPRTLDEQLYLPPDLAVGTVEGVEPTQALLATYRLGLAESLARRQQSDQALTTLDLALEARPDYAPALFLRADLLLQQGLTWAALGSLKSAVELDPQPTRLYALARLYLQLGELDESLSIFQRLNNGVVNQGALALNPAFFADFGRAYQQSGQFQKARWAFSQALRLQPTNPALSLALAESFLADHEPASAVQPLQEAVVHAPTDATYRLALADLYRKLGWWQEANGEYEQARKLEPTNLQAWLRSGQTLTQLEQARAAEDAFNQALQLDENSSETHFELGRLYLTLHRAA